MFHPPRRGAGPAVGQGRPGSGPTGPKFKAGAALAGVWVPSGHERGSPLRAVESSPPSPGGGPGRRVPGRFPVSVRQFSPPGWGLGFPCPPPPRGALAGPRPGIQKGGLFREATQGAGPRAPGPPNGHFETVIPPLPDKGPRTGPRPGYYYHMGTAPGPRCRSSDPTVQIRSLAVTRRASPPRSR